MFNIKTNRYLIFIVFNSHCLKCYTFFKVTRETFEQVPVDFKLHIQFEIQQQFYLPYCRNVIQLTVPSVGKQCVKLELTLVQQ